MFERDKEPEVTADTPMSDILQMGKFNMWPRDDRPDWEKMSDDSMNKFLKFCITCFFLYCGYHFVVAVIERFF